jgi:hypothetical protein
MDTCDPSVEKRRPLDSYTDAEIEALYAETADEDREFAALGLREWLERLDAEDTAQ